MRVVRIETVLKAMRLDEITKKIMMDRKKRSCVRHGSVKMVS